MWAGSEQTYSVSEEREAHGLWLQGMAAPNPSSAAGGGGGGGTVQLGGGWKVDRSRCGPSPPLFLK